MDLSGLLADPVTRAAAVPSAAPSPEPAADPDSAVREAVAAHPDLPTLTELLGWRLRVRGQVHGRRRVDARN